MAYKGVLLEGVEAAFIVATFGAGSGGFLLPGLGAGLALVVAVGLGLALHRPLKPVPEHMLKLWVGILLCLFGTFWGGEGLGVDWTLGDLTLPLLALFYVCRKPSSVNSIRRPWSIRGVNLPAGHGARSVRLSRWCTVRGRRRASAGQGLDVGGPGGSGRGTH